MTLAGNYEVGSAYVSIYPNTSNFSKNIVNGLNKVDLSPTGSRMGQTIGSKMGDGAAKGLSKAKIAIGTALGNVMSAGINGIANSMDRAISRVDTLNNFPRIMANMGISADDSKRAMDRLTKGIDGLPTALDDAVSSVSRFVSKSGNIDQATSYFLAANDAILAGGGSMEIQKTAMEQLSQSYAKGRMDMMEWRSLQVAMPAQLNQVAQAMGMTTDALGEGLRNGTISMDDFMGTLVRLDSEGTGNFASFADQAKSATGGIGTALANLRNRIVNGLAQILDKIGQQNIANIINGISTVILSLMKVVAGLMTFLSPVFAFIGNHSKAVTVAIMGIGGAFAALAGPAMIMTKITSMMTTAKASVSLLKSGFGLLKGGIAAIGGPLTLVGVAIAALAAGFVFAYTHSEEFRNKVNGLVASLGQALGPVIHAIGDFFTNTLIPAFQQAAPVVGEILLNAFSLFASFVTNFVIPALRFIGNIIVTYVIPALQNIAGFVQTYVLPVLQALANFIMTYVAPVLSAIASVIGTVVVAAFSGFAQFIGAVVIPILQRIWSFISGSVITVFQTLGSIVRTIGSVFGAFASTVSGAMGNAVSFVRNGVTNVINGFRNMGSNIKNAASSAASSVMDRFRSMGDGIRSAVDAAMSNALARFNDFRSSVINVMDHARSVVYNAADSIRNAFANIGIRFPHISLPHFNWHWENIGGVMWLPHFDGISWYAKGGIVDGASIIGAGEAGPEAIVPLSTQRRMRPFAQAVAREQDTGGEIAALREDLRRMRLVLDIDGRRFAEATVGEMDRALGNRGSRRLAGGLA